VSDAQFGDQGPRHCERCGTILMSKAIEGRRRPICAQCGFIVYLNPKVAAGAIVAVDGRVVLVKRGIPPSIGKWVFPGGYVDRGEPTDVAAVREVSEECGLDVEIQGLVGVFSYPGVPVVLVVYDAAPVGAALSDGDHEVLEVATFLPSEIPWDDLGFDSTREALKVWLDSRPE
jgi:ADP-ribose pyrophosphatase YjhB (NUDIX family)